MGCKPLRSSSCLLGTEKRGRGWGIGGGHWGSGWARPRRASECGKAASSSSCVRDCQGALLPSRPGTGARAEPGSTGRALFDGQARGGASDNGSRTCPTTCSLTSRSEESIGGGVDQGPVVSGLPVAGGQETSLKAEASQSLRGERWAGDAETPPLDPLAKAGAAFRQNRAGSRASVGQDEGGYPARTRKGIARGTGNYLRQNPATHPAGIAGRRTSVPPDRRAPCPGYPRGRAGRYHGGGRARSRGDLGRTSNGPV